MDASISVATYRNRALALGFGEKIIVARYPAHGPPDDAEKYHVVVSDGQVVRAVGFVRLRDGPLCLVSAGDSKFLNVYDADAYKERTSAATDGAAAGEWKPAYRYGPHAKRITSVSATSDGTIIFADKFGEVFILKLYYSPAHTVEVQGDAKNPATPLLQHFSTITTLRLTSPVPRVDTQHAPVSGGDEVPRRLFTCDKDCHVRVSHFPDTYRIEQFLYTRDEAQSVVTSVLEIPAIIDADSIQKSEDALAVVTVEDAPISYYALGNLSGDVHFWAARNDVAPAAHQETFSLLATYRPLSDGGHSATAAASEAAESGERPQEGEQESEPSADMGPGRVVSMRYVSIETNADGSAKHPHDCPRGVLVAFERSRDIHFVPLLDGGSGAQHLHPAPAHATRTPLEDFPVVVFSVGAASVGVLQRSGAITVLTLQDLTPEPNVNEQAGSFSTARAGVTVADYRLDALQAAVADIAPAATLRALDLSGQWSKDASDPRTRKAKRDADGDDGSDDGGASDGSASDKGSGEGEAHGSGKPAKKRSKKE